MSDPNLPEDDGNSSKAIEEVDVLSSVVRQLKGLTPEARQRVVTYVTTYFNLLIRGMGASGHGANETGDLFPDSGAKASSFEISRVPSVRFSENRAPSPKDFLFDKKPATEVERVACLAYYLAHYRDSPHFKTLDLSKLNTEAAQLKMSNPATTVENAVKSGLLVPAGKGAKQLSALGEMYVQSLPDRAAARAAIAHARPRRNRRKVSRSQNVGSDLSDDDNPAE